MAIRGIWLIPAALVVCGCAANLSESASQRGGSLRLLADSTPSASAYASDDSGSLASEAVGGYATAGDDDLSTEQPSSGHSSLSIEPSSLSIERSSLSTAHAVEPSSAEEQSIESAPIAAEGAPPAPHASETPAVTTLKFVAIAQTRDEVLEEVPAPAPIEVAPYKPATEDESKIDRFQRQIVDVPVDIRPTEGLLPEDIGAEKFAAEPTIDESLPSGEPAHVFCSYTPWTICYRPLYFEDIGLERYGKNVGCLQTGLSGVRFFGSVAALPYKMTRRPPRSCECSNGFSRPGDCPLPGYGNRRFQWNAALVEAAMVTAVVYIIP